MWCSHPVSISLPFIIRCLISFLMATNNSNLSSLEVISLNCQGLRSPDSRDTMFSWLNCCKVDILCLQETHSVSQTKFEGWVKAAQDAGVLSCNYSCVSSSGRHRSCGVAIFYNSCLSLSSCARDQHSPLLCAQLTSNSTTFQVCNIYGSNKAKDGDVFFESLYPVLDLDLPCILCGDFNTMVDPYMDRQGCNPTSPWAYNWSRTLTNLMSCYNLQDIWWVKHPSDYAFTWQ